MVGKDVLTGNRFNISILFAKDKSSSKLPLKSPATITNGEIEDNSSKALISREVSMFLLGLYTEPNKILFSLHIISTKT